MALLERADTVWVDLRKAAGGYWWGLAPRERAWSAGAMVVISIALLWSLAVAPALRILVQSEAQQHQLDVRWQQIQRLEAEARTLKAQKRVTREEAVRALEASARSTLGSTAELTIAGDRATLTLKNASAQALALWLNQVRINGHLLPTEARLQRSAVLVSAAPGAPAPLAMASTSNVAAASVGGLMPGVGMAQGPVAPPSDAPGVPRRAETTPPATWSGTLLLNLP